MKKVKVEFEILMLKVSKTSQCLPGLGNLGNRQIRHETWAYYAKQTNQTGIFHFEKP